MKVNKEPTIIRPIEYEKDIDQITDHIELANYNPEWPKMAASEIARLKQMLPVDNILEYAHVGSTAVPGLIAKPIIDIQIAVKSLALAKHELIQPRSQSRFYK